MLPIYDYLVDVTKQYIGQAQMKATVRSKIGRSWHKYRFIQVIPDGWDSGIHYEYCNGFWELHFEEQQDTPVLCHIRKQAIKKIDKGDGYGWHSWFGRKQGLYRIEKEIDNVEDFTSSLKELYDATYSVVNDIIAHGDSETPDSGIEIAGDAIIGGAYKKPKRPEIKSIAELQFQDFRIPGYQRPYKWMPKNINQLIDDILCFKTSSEYRLGAIVLHCESTTTNEQYLNIVDGQQRIISLSLILYLLMREEQLAECFTDDVRESISAFLECEQFSDGITLKNIVANLKVISHRLGDFNKDVVTFLLNKCKFVVITLYDISEAFQFFDSQNARGKELAPHDLLKAFHLRAIEKMSDEDNGNIAKWEESSNAHQLEPLFLMLYRVKRWIGAKEARFFTAQGVSTFKGLNPSDDWPYRKIYTIAQCYAAVYNNDVARRIDKNRLLYPHQIDQVIINGSVFFDMIVFYQDEVHELEKIKKEVNPRVMAAVESLNRGQGDKYIRLLFDAACLFYYDKFGTDNLPMAMNRIFAWAYGKRLTSYAIKLATVDNMARGDEGESFFRMLHNAVRPSDVLNWSVSTIAENDIGDNQKESHTVINLMKELRYVNNE